MGEMPRYHRRVLVLADRVELDGRIYTKGYVEHYPQVSMVELCNGERFVEDREDEPICRWLEDDEDPLAPQPTPEYVAKNTPFGAMKLVPKNPAVNVVQTATPFAPAILNIQISTSPVVTAPSAMIVVDAAPHVELTSTSMVAPVEIPAAEVEATPTEMALTVTEASPEAVGGAAVETAPAPDVETTGMTEAATLNANSTGVEATCS